jgi:membrane protease subunit (stomatin/prohibitin family)
MFDLTGGRTMNKRKISGLFISSMFVIAMMAGVEMRAQNATPPSNAAGQQAKANKAAQNHSAAQTNPSCQKIVAECKNLGFIVGEWKQDNGLWKDCFNPVVKGGTPTRDGKPISVPVSPNDVQACRAAQGHAK